jgi:RimJ/RimL family protein N-acetyltransferase
VLTSESALPTTLAFRPMVRADLPMFAEWTARPHVAEWWESPGTLAEIEEEYVDSLSGVDSTRCFIVLGDAAPIGFIQVYSAVDGHADGWWLDEHDVGVRGIDQFLAHQSQLNRGLGTRLIRTFVAELFRDPMVTRVQTDPAVENARAIRCYTKAGFVLHREVETTDGRAALMYCERPGL